MPPGFDVSALLDMFVMDGGLLSSLPLSLYTWGCVLSINFSPFSASCQIFIEGQRLLGGPVFGDQNPQGA